MRILWVVVAAMVAVLWAAAAAHGAVVVKAGDTLSGIAVRHGTTVGALAAANGITNPNAIVAGRRLALPGGAAAPSAPSSGGGVITVAPGDTLSGIAARHGTSAAALAAANGIRNPNAIIAGQRLALPGGAAMPSAPAAAPSSGGGGITVAPGDTLSGIAARHGTSAAALAAANGISNPNAIVAGQRLRLPGSAGSAGAPAALTGGGYRIRAGDTLSGIAARHGTSAGALARLNGIRDRNRIVVGTILQVPGGGSVAPAAAVPSGASVRSLIDGSAARHGVDPALARAVAYHESGFNQAMISSVGAIGVMQLMPGTAAWFGPEVLGRAIDPHLVDDNVEAGVAYLGWLQRQAGNVSDTLAAYYQGLTSVRRRGYYDDTRQYVANVLAQMGRV